MAARVNPSTESKKPVGYEGGQDPAKAPGGAAANATASHARKLNESGAFSKVSPEQTTEFNFEKVIAHEKNLKNTAHERYAGQPNYAERDEKGHFVSLKELQERNGPGHPEDQTLLNPELGVQGNSETQLLAFNKKGTPGAKATLESAYNADQEMPQEAAPTQTTEEALG